MKMHIHYYLINIDKGTQYISLSCSAMIVSAQKKENDFDMAVHFEHYISNIPTSAAEIYLHYSISVVIWTQCQILYFPPVHWIVLMVNQWKEVTASVLLRKLNLKRKHDPDHTANIKYWISKYLFGFQCLAKETKTSKENVKCMCVLDSE